MQGSVRAPRRGRMSSTVLTLWGTRGRPSFAGSEAQTVQCGAPTGNPSDAGSRVMTASVATGRARRVLRPVPESSKRTSSNQPSFPIAFGTRAFRHSGSTPHNPSDVGSSPTRPMPATAVVIGNSRPRDVPPEDPISAGRVPQRAIRVSGCHQIDHEGTVMANGHLQVRRNAKNRRWHAFWRDVDGKHQEVLGPRIPVSKRRSLSGASTARNPDSRRSIALLPMRLRHCARARARQPRE